MNDLSLLAGDHRISWVGEQVNTNVPAVHVVAVLRCPACQELAAMHAMLRTVGRLVRHRAALGVGCPQRPVTARRRFGREINRFIRRHGPRLFATWNGWWRAARFSLQHARAEKRLGLGGAVPAGCCGPQPLERLVHDAWFARIVTSAKQVLVRLVRVVDRTWADRPQDLVELAQLRRRVIA